MGALGSWCRKIWHDPVWSKVIASAICGLFLLVVSLAFWSDGGATISAAFHWLERSSPRLNSAWLVLVVVTSWTGLRLLWKLLGRLRGSGVKKRFEDLERVQKRFLLNQFSQGTRKFTVPRETYERRWFEELEVWGYVEYEHTPIHISGSPVPHVITEAGWKELQTKAGVLG